jgi:hypothetical protein
MEVVALHARPSCPPLPASSPTPASAGCSSRGRLLPLGGAVQILGHELLRRPLQAVVLHKPNQTKSTATKQYTPNHHEMSPPQEQDRTSGGKAVLGGAARHGEVAVRAGVGGRECFAEHVRHPREPPHDVLVLLTVVVTSCAPVLPCPRPRRWGRRGTRWRIPSVEVVFMAPWWRWRAPDAMEDSATIDEEDC